MKKLFIIFTLLLQSSLGLAQDYSNFLIVQNPPKNNFENNLLIAKNMALKSIDNFMSNPISEYDSNSEVKETLDKMLEGLHEAALAVANPTRGISKSCIKNVMYIPFLPAFQNSVRVCNSSEKLDLNQLYQSIIHESFHISEGKRKIPYDPSREGLIRSEGLGTVYEFSIMNTLHRCIYLDSPYYPDDGDKKSEYHDVKSFIISEYETKKPKICPGYKNKQNIVDL
ncbi:MAG: hypothetical protein V4596_09830 [Bdellovibrionota bacterium]